MKPPWQDQLTTARLFARNFAYLPRALRISFAGHPPAPASDVPDDFFGICVAGSPDPACDDYIIERLTELEIRHARVDLMQNANEFQERLIQRLLDDGFRVCLHLVQQREEAAGMHNRAAQQHWRGFVAATLDHFGDKLEMVEIGSTVNRRKWAGHTLPGFLLSWRIAWVEAKNRNITIAGPNVTDFEPIYNIALLHEMKRMGMLPDIHTDNLFVERATEPEAFDHKILGRRMAGLIRFNLLKKAFMLNDISRRAEVSAMICPHVSWSTRRIARMFDDVEQKHADYTARYCCLAAASGALKRLYWGPMIGQREGLIDDGTSEFPDIPHVTFYGKTNGKVAGYRPRPAFAAFQTAVRLIAGTRFQRRCPTGASLEIIEFADTERVIHAIWTMDGRRARAQDCYAPDALTKAIALSRDGEHLASAPDLFSESPTYLSWPVGAQVAITETSAPLANLRFAEPHKADFALIDQPPWTGATLASETGAPADTAANAKALLALAKGNRKYGSMLRNARNKVWTAAAPWNGGTKLVIKRFKPRSLFRRLIAPGKPDKAVRSWNGAQELARRGIATPLPIAFFHKKQPAPESECWFICREYENAESVRNAFEAFSAGSKVFGNMSADAFFEELAGFLMKMHERGVFFRDLSAGNILCRFIADANIEFALIDTARARFYPRPLGIGLRLCDLMRICHPLHWPGRDKFLGTYLSLTGRRFKTWMKAPFVYYDLKHAIKNAIKPFRPGKRKGHGS